MVSILGTFAMLVTYLIVWGGQTLLVMKIMQVSGLPFGSSFCSQFSLYDVLLSSENENNINGGFHLYMEL